MVLGMIGKIEIKFLEIVLFLLAPYTWANNKEIVQNSNRLEQTSNITQCQTQVEFWILDSINSRNKSSCAESDAFGANSQEKS